MRKYKKAEISMDMMAISVISIIVVVISIMVYFDIIERNRNNLDDISDKAICPEENNCTAHQCQDVLGSIPMVAETNDPRYICCERSCMCPNGEIELNGIKYTCHPAGSCADDEVKKDLKTEGGDCCCKKV
jgi:hypothetical protein